MSRTFTTLNLERMMADNAAALPGTTTFVVGDSLEAHSKTDLEALLVWLERPQATRIQITGGNILYATYPLQWQVLDQERDNGIDRAEVLSRCQAAAQRMVAWIMMNNETYGYQVPDHAASIVQVWIQGAELWAGVRVEMEIEALPTSDGCDAL